MVDALKKIRMTSKRFVLRRYPSAKCWNKGGMFRIYTNPRRGVCVPLNDGWLKSRKKAWLDAARRIVRAVAYKRFGWEESLRG